MSKQISIRLDAEQHEAIERVAAEERRPVSNLVRNVLADYLVQRRTQERVAA